MSIEFRCKCGLLLCTADDTIGRMALCPKCGLQKLVPAPDESAATPVSSSANVVDSAGSFSFGRFFLRSIVRLAVFMICFLAIVSMVVVFHYQRNTMQFDSPEDAIPHYQSVLQQDPADVEAHNELGQALFQLGQVQEAIEHYKQSLRLNPNSFTVHYYLGLALLQIGRHQDASEQFLKAIKLRPNYVEAHYNLGLAHEQMDNPQEAMKCFRHAVKLKSDYSEAYYHFALSLEKLGSSSEAVVNAKKALKFAKSKNQTELVKQIEEWLENHGN